MKLEFACKETAKLYQTGKTKVFQSIVKVALRKLDMIEAAATLNDLKAPPGNRLEALRGNRSGQHSIRINNQWRICFCWDERTNTATQIEIVDYH